MSSWAYYEDKATGAIVATRDVRPIHQSPGDMAITFEIEIKHDGGPACEALAKMLADRHRAMIEAVARNIRKAIDA